MTLRATVTKVLLAARQAPAAALLAAVVLSVQACESTPAAAPKATPTAAAPSAPAAAPRRLEANRGNAAASASPSASTTAKPDSTASLLESGSEVDGNVGSLRVSPSARALAQRGGSDPVGAAPQPVANQNPDEQHPVWAILLASFAEENHRVNAEAARTQIVQRFPALKAAYVRTTNRGSVVLYGRFEGVQDPAAQEELKRVKDLGEGAPKTFARAMLTRLSASPNDAPPGPNDLRTVRQVHPKGTLYTLQVAAWSALGTKEMTMSQIKRSAEGYAQQLRTQGYEAYFFHDFDTQTSTVTVGVFGPDSYDSRSTLFAPEVEAMMRKFPKSLLNGEEVLIPVDPKRPGTKMVPQAARLVEIPR